MTGRALTLCLVVALAGCAGATATSGEGPAASDSEWRALATPRPEPLPGAARVSIASVELVGTLEGPEAPSGVPPQIAVEELVATGLLRRRDVDFVERRRFTVAARAEREGLARPRGAPAAGVSPGAELIAAATWVRLDASAGQVEVRLTRPTTGAVETSVREPVVGGPGPVEVARAVVRATTRALEELDRRPAWVDPLESAGSTSPVPERAVAAFMRGLGAESRWSWEGARVGYAAAAEAEGFYEARAALARAARLRMGGTLGES